MRARGENISSSLKMNCCVSGCVEQKREEREVWRRENSNHAFAPSETTSAENCSKIIFIFSMKSFFIRLILINLYVMYIVKTSRKQIDDKRCALYNLRHLDVRIKILACYKSNDF
jgi:hypothetical protein